MLPGISDLVMWLRWAFHVQVLPLMSGIVDLGGGEVEKHIRACML